MRGGMGRLLEEKKLVKWIDKEVRKELSVIREMGDRKFEGGYQFWLSISQ